MSQIFCTQIDVHIDIDIDVDKDIDVDIDIENNKYLHDSLS